MRRFVVIGQRATASPEFSLLDLAGTSGRIDVLLRCLPAALLVSHGLRRDTIVYLVMGDGMHDAPAPRVLRVDGRHVRFIRPDERSLASMMQKALARETPLPGFNAIRAGLDIAAGGLEVVLDDLGASSPYVLEEGAADIRVAPLGTEELDAPVFFLGDHLGFAGDVRARIAAFGAVPLGVGPTSLHADHAITIVANELDRRAPPAPFW